MVVKSGFESNLYVGNSVINMYLFFGRMEDAHEVFNQMSEWDVVSWTSLLGGYGKHGDMDRAWERFDLMPVRNDVPCAVMVSRVLGCGRYIEALTFFHNILCDG